MVRPGKTLLEIWFSTDADTASDAKHCWEIYKTLRAAVLSVQILVR